MSALMLRLARRAAAVPRVAGATSQRATMAVEKQYQENVDYRYGLLLVSLTLTHSNVHASTHKRTLTLLHAVACRGEVL